MNNVKLNCADKEIAQAVCDAFQEAHFEARIAGSAVVTNAVWGRDHAVVAEIMSMFFCIPEKMNKFDEALMGVGV